MGTDLNIIRPFDENESFIKESIFIELTSNGIDPERLYFCDFAVVLFNDKTYSLRGNNTINELCDILKNNNKKIGINVNGMFAEILFTYILYDELNIDFKKNNLDWKNEIRWGYLE